MEVLIGGIEGSGKRRSFMLGRVMAVVMVIGGVVVIGVGILAILGGGVPMSEEMIV